MNNKEIIDTFKMYSPDSSGNDDQLCWLTVNCVKNIFFNMYELVNGDVETFDMQYFNNDNSSYLKTLLDSYNSDKATKHDYYIFYSHIMSPGSNVKMLEVGLGTNNEDVVSSMGSSGSPGASIRAFRDYLNGPVVYGADIDTRILFEEDRIKTFYVDQLNLETFNQLPIDSLDILIDDGLHSIDANVLTIAYGMKAVKDGGYIIIEDIPEDRTVFYKLVSSLLPGTNKTFFIKGKYSHMFVINKGV